MSKETTYQGKRGVWQRLSTALLSNSSELGHMEVQRVSLMALYDRVQGLVHEQGELTGRKQELSKQIREAVEEGERLATVLRFAVKQHYGIRAEKLAEFGLQPFRGKSRKQKPLPPPEDASPKS
ncbi:MAG TPA: hypothetical protein VMW27_18655 [Thermoanaerobaculia bacterium]|nr:hypothetical protein [Thermoanaerobaculia bacterium]